MERPALRRPDDGRGPNGPRTSFPIIRVTVPDTDDYVAVASMGGAPKSPAWYFNMVARPDEVTLQDAAVKRRYVAMETTGEERRTLWQIAAAVYPPYDEYQTRTDRVIPVMRLTPSD